jgi:hypothetical protein
MAEDVLGGESDVKLCQEGCQLDIADALRDWL